MGYTRKFFSRIWKDLKQKDLLPLKILFFMHSSTILVLYPYLTIHMRELGINVEETAVMSAVTPAVAILMPPLAGMLADKIGNFRVMLAIFSSLGGCSALLLLIVPVGRVTVTYADEVNFGLACPANSSMRLSMSQDFNCKTINSDLFETKLSIRSCGFACQAVLNENQIKLVLNSSEYDVKLHNINNDDLKTYSYTLTEEDKFVPTSFIPEFGNRITLKNNERYRTSIRKLSKNLFYFPTNHLFNFSCNVRDENNIKSTDCSFGLNKYKNDFNVGLSLKKMGEDDIIEERQSFKVDFFETKDNTNIKCGENILLNENTRVSISVPSDAPNTSHLDLGSCYSRCIATAERTKICSNQKDIKELDMKLTFWSYMAIRVFIGIISGTSFAMFEGAAIAILREHKADYGLQRIYATIGGMLSSPFSGWLIDYASNGKGYNDFRPIFYLYASLKVISGILMLFINLEFKKPAESVVADVINVLKKLEIIALFVSALVLGSTWGYIESFLFWLLQDLGGSKSLMGLTITVAGIVGIPLLVVSGPIIKKIGHANVIFVGFIFYAIRLVGYSLIYNPWLCLIFEAMEAITFGLSFTAAVTYAARLSTMSTDTTIQGLLVGIYYGVGKGLGSLAGGYLIKAFGIRFTFQVFATVALGTGILYWGFYNFYMKHRPSEGVDITFKEKTPNIQDVKPNGNQPHQDIMVVYEDALVNPAFQDTEFDDDDNKNVNNTTQIQA